MKEGIIMSAVRNSSEVKDAVRKIIERRTHEPKLQGLG
jgi:hypothetical protein